MSTVRTFGRNILSNWAGYGVNAVVTLLLTPIVVDSLGEARYGLWVLANSVVGYYGLLDLGFRAGVTQYLTRYLASKQYKLLNQSASSAFAALSVIGVAVFAASLLLGWFAPSLLDNVTAALATEAFWCIVIFGAAGAIQFSFFPFSATLIATQRFDIANAIGITSRILMAIGIYSALSAGYGLVSVCLVTAAANILADIARAPIAHRLVPQLRIRPALAAWARCREIMSFGLWNFLITMGESIMVHGAPWIIVTVFAGQALEATGFYNLAAAVFFNLHSIINPVLRVFYPAATEFHAAEKTKELKDLYLNGSRLVVLLVGLIFVLAWFLIPSFYNVWLADSLSGDYGTLDDLSRVARILLITLLAAFFPGISNQILLGMKRVQELAICVATMAAIYVGLAVVLGPRMGLDGIAWSAVAAVLVTRTLVFPILVAVRLGVSVPAYILAVAPRALLVGLPTAAIAYALSSAYQPTNLLTFFLLGGAMGASALPIVLAVGLTRQERQTYVWSRLPLPASFRGA